MGAVVRPVVRFGRRKGKSRQSTPSNGFSEDEITEGIFLPVGVDLRQIMILPKAEWERIQDSLNATSREEARIHAERKERKALHLQSQAIVNNWTNTIAGMTQGKLKAKKIREEKNEKERRLADLEEAKYQAQKRKEAIEEAKLIQYYQNDRVKGFHRALLLTEVLKERDAQIEFKEKIKNLYQSRDEEIERERQKAILKEEEKAKQRHMKRMQLNQDQLEQIKEHEHLAELARLADIREGKEIEALTRLYHMEMHEKEQKEYEGKLRRRRAHQEHVADQITLRAIEKQKQEEEDEKMQTYFKAKQAMSKLRNAKEEEILRTMEEQRERISNHLLSRIKKQTETEDDRIAREIAEKEEDQTRELEAKEEKNKADLQSIKEYRMSVIKMKEEKEKQEKLEAKEKLRELMEADRIYQELEKDKKRRNHCANLKLQEAHVMQIAEKMAREECEKQEETEYVRQKELIALCKEKEFQEYAKKVIDEESKTAQNLYPLFKAIKEGGVGGQLDKERGSGKSTTYTGDTAQEMKLLNEYQYGHTKSRLGFTW